MSNKTTTWHNHYTLDDLQDLIVPYIEDSYPKGHAGRGMAVVNVTLFTEWLRKRELKDN